MKSPKNFGVATELLISGVKIVSKSEKRPEVIGDEAMTPTFFISEPSFEETSVFEKVKRASICTVASFFILSKF